MSFYLSSEVTAAVISAVVSIVTARISFCINRNNTEAEIAKLKLEFEHSDKVRQENVTREISQELKNNYSQALSAVDWFVEVSDMNTKQSALSAINALLAGADEGMRGAVLTLKRVISESDPFEGPDSRRLQAALDEVSVQFFQQ